LDVRTTGHARGSTSGGGGRGGKVGANATQAVKTTHVEMAVSMFAGEKLGVPDLNPDQWQSLLLIINSHKANFAEKMTGKAENVSSVVDIGTLGHVIGTLEKLKDLRKISASPMGLQIGGHVLATKEWTIRLDNDLVLSIIL